MQTFFRFILYSINLFSLLSFSAERNIFQEAKAEPSATVYTYINNSRNSESQSVISIGEGSDVFVRVPLMPFFSPEVEMVENTSPRSLNLGLFTEHLKGAAAEMDLDEIDRLFSMFKDSEDLDTQGWQGKAEETRVLISSLQTNWKTVIGGEIFFSALDEPHLNLIKQALHPLKEVDGGWEEAYEHVRSAVFKIIKRHTRFHHLGLLQSLAISATFNHPIARLIVGEYMHLLNESLPLVSKDTSNFLNQNRRFVSLALVGSREVLSSFLGSDTSMFMDLAGEDLKDRGKVLAHSRLGLSYYDRVLGDMCLQLDEFNNPSIKDSSASDIEKALRNYENALEKNDPKASYVIANTLREAVTEQKMKLDPNVHEEYICYAREEGYFDACDKPEDRNRIRLKHYNFFGAFLRGKK